MKRTTSLVLALIAAACSTSGPMPPEELLVLSGGTVLAGERLEAIEPAALVIRGSKIAWVGPAGSMPSWAADARTIDTTGMTLMPGLIDAHAHVGGLGEALDTVDLVGTRSYEEVVDRIAHAASDELPGEWILGRGWDQNDWTVKEFPTASALDAAVGDRPVWISRIDGHAALASTAAMRAARITRETAEPAGGKILRNADGSPTGVFVDEAMRLIDSIVPPPSRTVRRKRIVESTHQIAARGLTAVHDAGVDQDTIQLMRELADAGELPIRVYALLTDDEELLDYWFERGPLLDYKDLLTVRSVKLYADGALGSRGAALLAPYEDDPGNRGLLIASENHIQERATRARAAGFQIGTHAIGDRAVRTVLDAYRNAGVVPASRFRIEHLQLVSPEDFARLANLGVIASMQPTHATSDMPWAEARVGGERIEGAYAWRSVLDAGGRLALGSDFPVESVDPLLGLYAAVTRQDLAGNPPGGWHPDERLTVEEAIRGFTLDAAYAAFEEDRRGSLESGKFADITIVQPDPTAVSSSEIPRTRVRYTIVNGAIVFRAE